MNIIISENVMLCMYKSTVPSLPPQNVTVTSTDPASLRVTWQLPSDIMYCTGPIIGHVIQYRRVESNDMMSMNVDSGTTHTISGLVACTEYSVRVAAKTVNGTGPFSTPELQVSGGDGKFNKICIHASMHVRNIETYVATCIAMSYIYGILGIIHGRKDSRITFFVWHSSQENIFDSVNLSSYILFLLIIDCQFKGNGN